MRTHEAAELVGRYLEELRTRRFSPHTIDKARRELPRLFERLDVYDVRAVAEEHLAAYARSLERHRTKKGEPLSPATRAITLSVVRRFFAFLAGEGVILINPAARLPLPKTSRLPRHVLTEQQAQSLMDAPPSSTAIGLRDRAILETLYGTAVRIGEAVRADVSDLDIHEGTLLVRNGKGRKDRLVPVPTRAAEALDRYLTEARRELAKGSGPALFLSRDGARLQAPGMRLMIRKHARAIDLHVSPHTLRRTCATHLLKGGADLRHVQALLGHRSIETTTVYTSVVLTDLRAVIERTHPRENTRRKPTRR